jgi:hypothetical protein
VEDATKDGSAAIERAAQDVQRQLQEANAKQIAAEAQKVEEVLSAMRGEGGRRLPQQLISAIRDAGIKRSELSGLTASKTVGRLIQKPSLSRRPLLPALDLIAICSDQSPDELCVSGALRSSPASRAPGR